MKRIVGTFGSLTLVVASLVLSACGEKSDDATGRPGQTPLHLVLDYLPNADHAGIYAAEKRGDFDKAGIDLKIRTPSDPAAPLKLVEAGRADLAISYEPELLLARDKGAPLVAVGTLVNRPLTSLMAVGSAKVKSVTDLAGKTVGTAGIPYQSAYLSTILERAGVPDGSVKRVDVGFNLIPAMVSKKVDATLGAFSNVEGVQLKRDKRDPVIIPMSKAGVPPYDELVFVANPRFLREHGELVRRFMQGLQAGTKAVKANPDSAVAPLADAAKGTDKGFLKASIAATVPALLPVGSHPFGYLDGDAWGRYGRWMQRNGLISHPASGRAITNEFLPGQGAKSDPTEGSSGGF